jgi:hypothetical protein
MGSGAALRFVITGAWMSLFAWIVGAMFIPALALALGVCSGSRRLFEMVYLLWWYLAFNGIVALDFIGITPESLERGNPWLFLGLTLGCLGLVVIWWDSFWRANE